MKIDGKSKLKTQYEWNEKWWNIQCNKFQFRTVIFKSRIVPLLKEKKWSTVVLARSSVSLLMKRCFTTLTSLLYVFSRPFRSCDMMHFIEEFDVNFTKTTYNNFFPKNSLSNATALSYALNYAKCTFRYISNTVSVEHKSLTKMYIRNKQVHKNNLNDETKLITRMKINNLLNTKRMNKQVNDHKINFNLEPWVWQHTSIFQAWLF